MEVVKLGFLIASCAAFGMTLGGRAEASPVGRTLAALEASSAERPMQVRMLFYGQSIVEQGWHTNIVRRLKERYPTARLEVENRAIGGFTSPDLIRTAESDLYPFYPDILFFHVYGPLDRYEAIIRKVRETTTAEIVLWSSHLNWSESADRATVEKSLKGHPDARTRGIREIAERYGCLFVDLRRRWGETMLAKGWTAKDLLADGVHMKRTSPAFALYSDTIADVLMGEAKGSVPAVSGDIEEIPLSDKRVVKGDDGMLTLDFDGNRVVAVSDGAGTVPVRVGLDGRSPASFPEMFYTTRPSKFISWMPMIKHVDIEKESRPVEEDWTLTFIPGTHALGDPIHYMVVGSKTGFDGEGWNTNDFRSISGRALVSKFDFHTWQYGYFVKKGGNKAVDSRPGQKVTWSTRGLFADPYRAPRQAGERTTLVQFCANGPHRLTLRPEGKGKIGVSRLIVYRPTRRDPIRIPVGPQERVKTPAEAQKEVRRIKSAHGGATPTGGIVVEFADGEYRLEDPLRLDMRDAGRSGAPVIWTAKNRGKVSFSGAVHVSGWRPWKDDILVADVPIGGNLPDFHGGSEEFYSKRLNFPLWLYQAGSRLDCARYPNRPAEDWDYEHGYLKTGATVGGLVGRFDRYQKSVSGVFRCASPRLAEWAKETDLWAYGLFMHEYADMKMAVTNVNLAAKTLALDNRWYPRGFRQGAPFYVFNARCEIDRPGEWALDRAARKLYLKPLAPVDAEPPLIGSTMYLVAATNLEHVVFDGLTFEYSRRDAVRFDACRDVTVRASTVRHTGAWGVTVAGGRNVVVRGCDLTDLGEGGVRLEGGDSRTLAPARHVADNNHISHYGKVIPSYRPGVSLAGVGCEATHNLIHHTPHQGVWFNGNDHRIAFNVIHDTCLYNDDAGAIYCCMRDFTKRGTVIEHNLVHGTGKRPVPTNVHSVYLDDWSPGTIVRGNIFSGATWAIHLGGGQGTVATNNVCLACERWCHYGSRRWLPAFARGVIDENSYLYRKLVDNRELFSASPWREKYPQLLAPLSFADKVVAHDPIFCILSNNVAMACGELEDGLKCKETLATCSIGGNLLREGGADFVDLANLDFNLKPDSPSWRKLGGNTRFDEMGLYADLDRATPPVKFGAGVRAASDKQPEPASLLTPPAVRIDILVDRLPDGVAALATQFERCYLLASQKGRRIVGIGEVEPPPDDGSWERYRFAFVPTCDITATLALSGQFGKKTDYRNVRVTGATTDREVSGLANHNKWKTCRIVLKKGEKVTVDFEARADPSSLGK